MVSAVGFGAEIPTQQPPGKLMNSDCGVYPTKESSNVPKRSIGHV
jgi:hypothetical protein